MNKEDIQTFSVTFKTTNEGYAYFLSELEAFTEVISDRILPETEELYKNDTHFKKLVSNVKKATRERDKYINDKL